MPTRARSTGLTAPASANSLINMKVIGPSKKLLAIANALHNAPPKQMSIEAVRAQVAQHLEEAKAEMLRSWRNVKIR